LVQLAAQSKRSAYFWITQRGPSASNPSERLAPYASSLPVAKKLNFLDASDLSLPTSRWRGLTRRALR
jgi:hypothetical protein